MEDPGGIPSMVTLMSLSTLTGLLLDVLREPGGYDVMITSSVMDWDGNDVMITSLAKVMV